MQLSKRVKILLPAVICFSLVILVVCTVVTHAWVLPVTKFSISSVEHPSWWFWTSDIRARTKGEASHDYLEWSQLVPHDHGGDGRAYASMGSVEVSDPPMSGPIRSKVFLWRIYGGPTLLTPGVTWTMKTHAELRGSETDSAFTYGWVIADSETSSSSAAN